jgi:hypothetical protein
MHDKAIIRHMGKQGFAGHVATIGASTFKVIAAAIEARSQAIGGSRPQERNRCA